MAYRIILIFLLVTSSSLIPNSNLKAQPVENSVFWQISGNELAEPSYLFGIINFLPKKDFSLPKVVRESIEQCKTFATRYEYTPQNINAFTKATVIPSGGMVNDYLTDDELNQLRLLMLRDFDVSEHDYHFRYSRLMPIILMTSTTVLHLGKNIVYTQEELARLAKKKRLKFTGLDTVEEEIAAFRQFPIEDQVQVLKHTVNEFDDHLNRYNKLVRYFVDEQNLDKIREEILKTTNNSIVFQDVYYHSKNQKWANTIADLSKANPTFIAIGAAHLGGEDGLVALLRGKGFEVVAVNAFE